MKNKILIVISVLVVIFIAFIAFVFITKPSKSEIEDYSKKYMEKQYEEAKASYLEDSIFYSKMELIDVASSTIINKLEYETSVEAVKKERAELANKMATPEEIERGLKFAMKYPGRLTLIVYSSTYEGANTGNYRVVMTDNSGKEFYREDLESSKPHASNNDSYLQKYRSLKNIYLEERPTFPFKVYVINQLRSTRDEFIVGEMKDLPEEHKLERIKKLEESLEIIDSNIEVSQSNMNHYIKTRVVTDTEKKEYEEGLEKMINSRSEIEKKIEYIKNLLKDEQAN